MDVSPAISRPTDDVVRTSAANGALSAILFREILTPLAAALGPAGDVVLDRSIDGLFVRPLR